MSSKNRRVVVTGIGAISPVGTTARSTFDALVQGKSGVTAISHFDAMECRTQIAAEARDFDPLRENGPFYPRGKEAEPITVGITQKDLKKFGRFIPLAVQAGLEAYGDSGIDTARAELDPTRMGCNFGVGMGGLPEIERQHAIFMEKGFKRISSYFILQVIPNMPAGQLSLLLNLQGPNLCNVTACASSAHSIGESYRIIQRGDADVMLVGGSEAVISALAVGGFAAMRALSTRNHEPQKASRPFDKDRDGFVMGEGAASLVLEDYEIAKKRGAKIYAELTGYGLSGDAFHLTSPAPEGEGGARAMTAALKDAGRAPQDIDYVNAHGTSTPVGDAEEAQAIYKTLGQHNPNLHISSTKSMTGHLLGAAGALESVISILAMNEGIIPPTINLDSVDEKIAHLNLNFCPHEPVKKKIRAALSNSFGFGGTNACLLFEEVTR